MEGHAEEGRMAKAKPPRILTNNFWPVRQSILSHLSYHDKRALAEAYPYLIIQEDAMYKRQKLLHQVEILSGLDSACRGGYLQGYSRIFGKRHSHFGHPLFNAIHEKSRILALDMDRHTRSTGKELASKTQEINRYISNISEDINMIPPVATELCLSVAPECCLRGYTALHVAAICNDVETARMLIEKGADMYRIGGSFQGNSLHTAVLEESIDVVRYFCQEMNMDKERKTEDTDKVTALQLAEFLALGDPGDPMYQIIQLLES